VFRHLTTSNGLSQPVVNAIAQDQRGYLWFATEDGLNRYDGYTVTSYRHNPGESSSLADNYIWRLQSSRNGDLLIGTFKGGLNLYHPSRDGFSSYRHDPEDTSSLSSDNVTAVLEDASGNLWVGTWFGGLNRLEGVRSSGRNPSPDFYHYMADPENPGTLSDNRVAAIVEDSQGILWIGTWNGLTRLDRETESLRRYLHDPGDPSSLGGNKIWSMCLDTKGNLWVATWGAGLSCLKRASGAFTTYRHDPGDPGSISSDLLRSVFVDSRGTVWAGTYDAGLNQFDEDRRTFIRYLHDPMNPKSLPSNEIQSLYQDPSGILWVGTAGGASSYDPKRRKFRVFSADPTDPNSLSNGMVHTLYADSGGGLWAGTLGGGLNYCPPGSESFRHFRHHPSNPNSLSSDLVLSVAAKQGGDLWIGTRGGGLNSFDRATGSFQRFLHDPAIPGSLALDDVTAVLETRSGTLWVGTNGGGLDRYDPATRQFVHHRHQPADSTSVSGHHIWSLFEDSQGHLWIGTWGADLNRYDPGTGRFVRYRHNPADPASLSSNTVLCMAEDTEGNLWFGTQDGLNGYDQTSFRRITERDGLPNNTVFGILPDASGHLWLSTGAGLTRFDPRAGTFRNFDMLDGLQGNAFNRGAYAQDQRGRMYFGGNNGFNAFHPDSIRDNPHRPPVVITQFKVFGDPFRLAPTKPLSITLDHDQVFFSIEYAALDYSMPEKNRYEYRMQGIDRDWVFADTRRYVSYSHLDGGTYRFQVRGSNGDGVWNDAGTSLIITIVPPFWDMWWFKTLAGLAGLLALWVLYRYRLKKLVEIERMRVRIASDLHDEVGSSLTKIALYSDLLKDNPDRSSAADFAGKIGEMSRNTVTTMSDIVWSIDARNDTIGDLIDRMRDTASGVLAAQQMDAVFQIDGLDAYAKLSVDLRENIFLIFKEAITNAAKYSGGSRITVRLSNRAGSFVMDIKDDGRGFSGKTRRSGQGLRNMEMRAERIGGKLTVSGEDGVRIRLLRAPL
jgi:ligand-binding sensor domain-containing protein/signal transduction histidine kinase